MSNSNEGDNVVAKVQGCPVCTITAAGAAFVKKVTHPPTIIPSEYLGVPDTSAPNMVGIEVKGESNFPPILTYGTTATTTNTINPRSMLFVSPSGGRNGCYAFLQFNPTTWVQPASQLVSVGGQPAITQVCSPAQANGGYNWANFTNDVSMFRTTYASTTYYLNATEFNNQGTVTTAKFKPNILRTTAVNLFASHAGDSRTLHSLRRALRLPDDDFEHVGSIPQNSFTIQVWELGAVSAVISPLPFTQMFQLTNLLPNNATDLLNFSSKAATRPAKEGSFVVKQKIGETYQWSDVGSFATNGSGNLFTDGPVVSLIRTPFLSGGFSYAALYSDADPLTATTLAGNYRQMCDIPWNNLDWEITLFEGLSIPTTVATTFASLPYVTVKTFAGLEIQPSISSSLQPFQRMLPLPDHRAVEMVAGIFHARPDSLPAKANDFGISAILAGLVPTAIGWLKDAFAPVASATKERVADVADRFIRPKKRAPKEPQPKQPKQPKAVKAAVTTERRLDKKIDNLAKMMASMNKREPTQLPTYKNSTAAMNEGKPPRRNKVRNFVDRSKRAGNY